MSQFTIFQILVESYYLPAPFSTESSVIQTYSPVMLVLFTVHPRLHILLGLNSFLQKRFYPISIFQMLSEYFIVASLRRLHMSLWITLLHLPDVRVSHFFLEKYYTFSCGSTNSLQHISLRLGMLL